MTGIEFGTAVCKAVLQLQRIGYLTSLYLSIRDPLVILACIFKNVFVQDICDCFCYGVNKIRKESFSINLGKISASLQRDNT